MTAAAPRSWNPLRCDGTALPVPVLLMAKLVTVGLLVSFAWRDLPDPFLPFLPALDGLRALGPAFRWGLKIVVLVAAAALLLNRGVRLASATLGAALLLGILASRPFFENNRLFAACVLLLAGLSGAGQTPWLLRLQVVLVYLGASANKAFDPDWRSGAFFTAWAPQFVKLPLYFWVDALLPAGLLARLMCWASMAGELGIGLGLLARRLRPWAIWGGILFHTGLLVLTGRTFGVFYVAILASYLAFVAWPRSLTMLYDGDCGFCDASRRLFTRLDLEGRTRWIPYQAATSRYGISEEALQQRAHLVVDGRVYAGFAAFKQLLLYNPVTYFVLAVALSLPEPAGWHPRRWLAVALCVVFFPLTEPLGERVYRLVARNRHRLPGRSRCALPKARR